MRVTRIDFAGPARSVHRTPQGGLRVEAAIARSGVLPYSDGTREWKEYRPPAEVFKADSMATAKGGPVTDLHPPKLVTPETFKAVSRGHACDDVRRDGDLLVVDLMVQDADLCALVESGERREVSCGYSCVVVPTPGVTPEGERYDAVQTQIVHNHVALLAPGTGRSGPEVSLRMDGAAVEVRLDGAGVQSMKYTLKIRGAEYRFDADDPKVAEKAQADIGALEKKADEGADAAATCDAVSKKLTETLAEVAMLKGQLTAAQAAPPPVVTEESVPAEVADALVAKRLALVTDARKVLGAEVKLDGLSADAIRRLVVETAFPAQKARLDAKDAKGQAAMHPAELLGMFTGAVTNAATRTDALGNARRPLGNNPNDTTRTDAADEGTPQGLAKRTENAWKKTSTQTANGSR